MFQQKIIFLSIFKLLQSYQMAQIESVRMTTLGFGNEVPSTQVYKGIFKLSLYSFGNQHSQVDQLKQKITRQYRWLSTSQFNQIQNLCWALPGPTVIQIIITLTTLKLRSPLAGFFAFIVFNIFPWGILFTLGTISSIYVSDQQNTQMTLMFLGFNAAAAGVMVKSVVQYLIQHSNNISTILIMITSAIIFFIFRTAQSITFCLIAGAIMSLYMQIQSKHEMTQRSKNLFQNIGYNFLLGKNSIIMFLSIYIFLWIFFSYFHDSKYVYIFIFYFCGTFIIGPAGVIFAYLFANFLQLNIMAEEQIWLGIPVAFLIPGSLMNGGIYFGVLVDGLRGMILSAIFLYLPCFLSLYGMLPQWRHYRSKPGVQRLVKGITCVTSGFLLAMIVLSLEHCIKVDVSSTFTIFIVSVFLNYVWGFYSFVIILLGGLLANVRRWGLIYYRGLPDRIY